MLWKLLLMSSIFSASTIAQFYEDQRCRCICPKTNTIINSTELSIRTLYIAYVPPNQCNCYGVILPRVSDKIRHNAQSFCPRCDCKYQTRNTTVIMVVVIFVLWMIVLLIVYYLFLKLLLTFPNKEKRTYNEKRTNSFELESLLLSQDEEDMDAEIP